MTFNRSMYEENEMLRNKLIWAEKCNHDGDAQLAKAQAMIAKLIEAGYAILREEGSRAVIDDAFTALADEWKAQK